MKTKSLNLAIAGIFAFVFLMSFMSAALTVNPSTITFNDNGTKTITVTSNDTTIDYDSTFNIDGYDFSVSGNKTLDSSNQTTLTITPKEDIRRDFDFLGSSSGTFKVWDSSETKTVNVQVQNENLCEYDNVGNDLYVDIKDVTVTSGYGKDNDWFPLDNIEVEVKVQNEGNKDINDIDLEWGLYDEENNEWAIDMHREDNFDIRDGDYETLTFNFNIDKKDLDMNFDDLKDGNYRLYVRATGEVDTNDNPQTCDYDSYSANMVVERDFVVLSNVNMPDTLQCDSTLQISGEVWNIGDRDQDNVEVKITSTDLGIEEYVPFSTINYLDSDSFSKSFDLPEELTAGTYFVKFSVLDEDGKVYVADNDDETAQFSRSIKITGDCSLAEATVSANLQEGGKAGKPMVIKSTIVNTGSKTSTYLLNVAGYADWANSADLSENTVTIAPGQSQEVLVTLDVKKDVEGEKSFNIELISNNKPVATQPVSVSVEKASFISFTGLAVGDNWEIWGIGLLNLVLVIVIIIVAIRISRRK